MCHLQFKNINALIKSDDCSLYTDVRVSKSNSKIHIFFSQKSWQQYPIATIQQRVTYNFLTMHRDTCMLIYSTLKTEALNSRRTLIHQ